MKSMKIIMVIIVITSIILTGCNNSETGSQLSEIESQLSETESQLNSSKAEVESLKKHLEEVKSENEKLKMELITSYKGNQIPDSGQDSYKNLVDEEPYKWIKEDDWDKIIVYNTYNSSVKIELKDVVFLKSPYLGHELIQIPEPTNGPRSDVGYYTYEFIKGDNIYTVNIVGSNSIEYNGMYFRIDESAYNLGKGLLPSPKYIQTDSILNKIYESGAVHGNIQFNYLCISTFRIHSFANQIQSGIDQGSITVLTKQPQNAGEVVESFTFYYYGTKIYMNVYNEYLSIKDGDTLYWYSIPSEYSITSVLSAG